MSKVVHFQHLPNGVTEAEIIKLVSGYGPVKKVVILNPKTQALVEMETHQAAAQVVKLLSSKPIRPNTKPVQAEIATSQSLNKTDSTTTTTSSSTTSAPKTSNDSQQKSSSSTTSSSSASNTKKPVSSSDSDSNPKVTNGTKNSDNSNSNSRARSSTSTSSHSYTNSENEETPKNRVVLVTILDCVYPITIDILHQIFSSSGTIEKISIFSKGVAFQSLVQYSEPSMAQQAIEKLNNQHIYAGVCRLSLRFSKLNDIAVPKNPERGRDFTIAQQQQDNSKNVKLVGLLPTPENLSSSSKSAQSSSTPRSIDNNNNNKNQISQQSQSPIIPQFGQSSHFQQGNTINSSYSRPQQHPMQQQIYTPQLTQFLPNTILLVSNLNTEKTKISHLYNLFSNYGTVLKIRILYNKPDRAFIQMADPVQAVLAQRHLKDVIIFGNKIAISISKYSEINGPVVSDRDGQNTSSENIKVYTKNIQNLQKYETVKRQKIPYPPSKTIHVSNLDSESTEEEIVSVFSSIGEIEGTKLFEVNSRRMCLVTFSSVESAVEALCLKQNHLLHDKVMRLAFSHSTAVSK